MQPKVLAALAALVLLSAPPAVLAAMLVHDLRSARRPLPSWVPLARLALALNHERAATPAQCRVAGLRRELFESGLRARALVAAHDDLHAAWLLGDALRLAARLDGELRGLWTLVDAAPDLLQGAASRVGTACGALDRLQEAVAVRAGDGVDEVLGRLVDGVEVEHALRLEVAVVLERGRLGLPPGPPPA